MLQLADLAARGTLQRDRVNLDKEAHERFIREFTQDSGLKAPLHWKPEPCTVRSSLILILTACICIVLSLHLSNQVPHRGKQARRSDGVRGRAVARGAPAADLLRASLRRISTMVQKRRR